MSDYNYIGTLDVHISTSSNIMHPHAEIVNYICLKIPNIFKYISKYNLSCNYKYFKTSNYFWCTTLPFFTTCEIISTAFIW